MSGNFESPYFCEDELKTYLKENITQENLSLLHWNVRSQPANFDNFFTMLEETDFIFNVICLSETCISDSHFVTTQSFN